MENTPDKYSTEIQYPATLPVFLIGASGKGGVKAFEYLAKAIPSGFPASFFFLLHRMKNSSITKHHLHNILASNSNLDIVVPQTGDSVESGVIYLPTYGHDLIIQNNTIVHTEEHTKSLWQPSIDALFISGAKEYKDRTVSVLLTGDLKDGIQGLLETTSQGGITVAQSLDDAYNPVLPLNALLEDHPKYVLPLRDMPALFCELAGYGCRDDQKSIAQRAAITAAIKKEEVKE